MSVTGAVVYGAVCAGIFLAGTIGLALMRR